MASQALVSVIVVVWNSKAYLHSCLDSLRMQTYHPVEIVVVDNGSRDGSVELVKTTYPNFVRVLIENQDNLGFAEANNQGIRESRGELIALLNSDAQADPHWLEELVVSAMKHPTVGMFASKVRTSGDPLVLDGTGVLLYPDGMSRARGRLERDVGQYDRCEEILLPSGCAALYRRTMLDEIGLFDQTFFAYCEDTDLGLRARLGGWKCLYIPSAVVDHIYSGGDRAVSEVKALNVERNHIWVIVKNFPFPMILLAPFFTVLRFLFQLAAILGATGMGAKFVRRFSKRKLLHILLQAYWQALLGMPAMLRERWAIRARKKVSDWEVYRWLMKYHLPVTDLTLKD